MCRYSKGLALRLALFSCLLVEMDGVTKNIPWALYLAHIPLTLFCSTILLVFEIIKIVFFFCRAEGVIPTSIEIGSDVWTGQASGGWGCHLRSGLCLLVGESFRQICHEAQERLVIEQIFFFNRQPPSPPHATTRLTLTQNPFLAFGGLKLQVCGHHGLFCTL